MPIPLELSPSARLRFGDESLDLVELARLLQAIGEAPRVGSAARALGVSYRGAWGKLVRAERLLGVALVDRVKGHGSRLTDAGAALAAAGRRFERESVRRLQAPASAFGEALAPLLGPRETALRVAASHDLLLQAVLADGGDARWSVRFVGSEQALRALAGGEAELAGFHLPEPLPRASERAAVFDDARCFVEAVMRREQGLIVARGNPRRVKDVADLARSGLRFVNRQRGAGTRAWFDRLLRERGLKPSEIAGYEREEFTHFAVAASVAAGLADAGFGLRAAAVQLDLGFVPIGTERYFVAGARRLRTQPAVRSLLQELRARASRTPGYARCRA
ncbi:MAG: LuxR family transcriptional regulator [Burkholderiales bacterium]|jgi:molybdate transport repressor ModE-like protein|nr:MAG: LuxR family transcriptional regulator [Burkholderiales bacterium]